MNFIVLLVKMRTVNKYSFLWPNSVNESVLCLRDKYTQYKPFSSGESIAKQKESKLTQINQSINFSMNRTNFFPKSSKCKWKKKRILVTAFHNPNICSVVLLLHKPYMMLTDCPDIRTQQTSKDPYTTVHGVVNFMNG